MIDVASDRWLRSLQSHDQNALPTTPEPRSWTNEYVSVYVRTLLYRGSQSCSKILALTIERRVKITYPNVFLI